MTQTRLCCLVNKFVIYVNSCVSEDALKSWPNLTTNSIQDFGSSQSQHSKYRYQVGITGLEMDRAWIQELQSTRYRSEHAKDIDDFIRKSPTWPPPVEVSPGFVDHHI